MRSRNSFPPPPHTHTHTAENDLSELSLLLRKKTSFTTTATQRTQLRWVFLQKEESSFHVSRTLLPVCETKRLVYDERSRWSQQNKVSLIFLCNAGLSIPVFTKLKKSEVKKDNREDFTFLCLPQTNTSSSLPALILRSCGRGSG
jgi:hypothetical protein